MSNEALKEFILKTADDLLLLGHRNSEWTGMGPLLEEDIAFSSMAQDKVGQSQAMYQLLHALGEPDPDIQAFSREASRFRNCVLVELPNREYDFSLIRHFLFDHAQALRFDLLTHSAYQPLADVSRKIRGELKYHTLHANTWVRQLGSASDESVSRLQQCLNELIPYALGIFENSPFEAELVKDGIFDGEAKLKELWSDRVSGMISGTRLKMPDLGQVDPVLGGRIGKHSEHLQPLLDEMSEVFRIDPSAEW